MLDNADTKSSALNIFFLFLTPRIPTDRSRMLSTFYGTLLGEWESIFLLIYHVLSFLETILWVLKVLPSTILWKHHMGKTDSDAFTNTLKRVLDSIVIASNLVPRSKRLSRLFVCKDWMRKYCSKYLPPATILPGGGVVRDKWNIFRVH